MSLTLTLVAFNKALLPSRIQIGFIQSAEGLKGKELTFVRKRES